MIDSIYIQFHIMIRGELYPIAECKLSPTILSIGTRFLFTRYLGYKLQSGYRLPEGGAEFRVKESQYIVRTSLHLSEEWMAPKPEGYIVVLIGPVNEAARTYITDLEQQVRPSDTACAHLIQEMPRDKTYSIPYRVLYTNGMYCYGFRKTPDNRAFRCSRCLKEVELPYKSEVLAEYLEQSLKMVFGRIEHLP